eukprot:scaffold139514_cov20-Tisochrysis_lutea.AAC.1
MLHCKARDVMQASAIERAFWFVKSGHFRLIPEPSSCTLHDRETRHQVHVNPRFPLPPSRLQTLDGLPNCVFDASGPLRQYSMQARVGGFFAKLAELSAVGAVTGGATSILSSAGMCIRIRLLISAGRVLEF